MNSSDSQYEWQWSPTGAAPATRNSDSEVFDTVKMPYSETVVREAIQNSLDARLPDSAQPVRVKFSFHEAPLTAQREFLQSAIKYRKTSSLPVPVEWQKGKIRWLSVEDFNATGLLGDLEDRQSDFWNYWLNFGLTNKQTKTRGGRGIGRVTFLLSSQVNMVLGYTKRHTDSVIAACGMIVLKPTKHEGRFRTTHAYLAKNEIEEKDIFSLYDESKFHEKLKSAFSLSGYDQELGGGLGLVIPYPHQELTRDGILASVIEHFAPAVLNGSLCVTASDNNSSLTLAADNISETAMQVREKFSDQGIRAAPERYLQLLRHTVDEPELTLAIEKADKKELRALKDEEDVKAIQKSLNAGKAVTVNVKFPLCIDGNQKNVNVKAVIKATPEDEAPIDCFFRDGMALPDVTAANLRELDCVLLVEDELLSGYLNLCEGKAHLDLLESKEIKEKLTEKGFSSNSFEKRLCKALPEELRSLFTPDISEPDADVFAGFFSIPDDRPGKKHGRKEKTDDTDVPVQDIPPPKPAAFVVTQLQDGLRITANKNHTKWPVSISITLAYADGSRKPSWSKYDFKLDDMNMTASDCKHTIHTNKVRIDEFEEASSFEITGFDINRELDARLFRVRSEQNA